MELTGVRDQTWFKPAAVLTGVLVLGLVGLSLLGSQVSGILSTVGASVGDAGEAQPEPDGDSAADPAAEGGGTDSSGTDTGGTEFVAAVPRADQLIIKTGTLTLQVEALDRAVESATKAIDTLGGYTSGSQRSGSGPDAEASVTFRVPAERWDEAMTAVRALATDVLSEQSTTDDVTAQVVDLGARIKNLQATEAALQSIMDRARVIKDVLTVQAELTTVRGQIEQRAAEKGYLEAQAAYSTLTATFVLKPAPVLVEQQDRFDPASEVDAASASLIGVLQAVATAGIWFGIVWLPILITVGVVSAAGWWALRRVRRLLPETSAGN